MDIIPLLTRLRRPLILTLSSLSALLIGIYLLLFSTVGNRWLQPFLASFVSEKACLQIIIDTFILTPRHYTLRLRDQKDNIYDLDGNYSLSKGESQGKLRALGANADYTATFRTFSLDALQLRFRHLDAAALLHRLDYPGKSTGFLHGDIHLDGLAERNIRGDVRLWSTTTSFIPSPIMEEDSNLSLDLYDLLADEDGDVKAFSIDCTAQIAFDEIGLIDQLIGYPLRGNITLNNRIHGDEKTLRFDIQTDLAHSDTHLNIDYLALLPHRITYRIDHADIPEVFRLFNRPSPLLGTLDSQGRFGPKNGTLELHVRNGRIRSDILKQEYHLTQPPLRFALKLNANISPKDVHYHAAFRSDLKRMSIDTTTTHTQMLSELLRSIP